MIPRPESPQNPADISPVIDLALVYNPALANADLSTIRMWCNQGCSIKDDILPTLKECMKRKKGVTRLHYWTNPILEARDKRLTKEKLADPKVAHSDEYYINIFRWKLAKGLKMTSEQENMLRRYEAKENPGVMSAGVCLVSNEVSEQRID